MSNPNDKDVLCTSCRTRFRLAYGEFDEWKRQGRVYSPEGFRTAMPHTVNWCPHCPPTPKPDVPAQLREVKRRLDSYLAAGVLSKVDAAERAVESAICAHEREFHPLFSEWLAARWAPVEPTSATYDDAVSEHEADILSDHHDNRTPG